MYILSLCRRSEFTNPTEEDQCVQCTPAGQFKSTEIVQANGLKGGWAYYVSFFLYCSVANRFETHFRHKIFLYKHLDFLSLQYKQGTSQTAHIM